MILPVVWRVAVPNANSNLYYIIESSDVKRGGWFPAEKAPGFSEKPMPLDGSGLILYNEGNHRIAILAGRHRAQR